MSTPCIAGLDLGSHEIKLVVAEQHEGRLIPRLFLRDRSVGIRRGAVLEPQEIAPILKRLLMEAERSGFEVRGNLYVNVGTTQLASQPSRGIVAVSRADGEIHEDDIDRVIKASQAINLGPNRTLLHNVVREFIVDGAADVSDPLGLSGSRLEVSSMVIDGFSQHVQHVIAAVEQAGGTIQALVLNALGSATSALSKERKQLGSAVIDLGAETTTIAAYEEGKLVGVNQLPIGGATLTHDLAIGLTVPVSVAEKVKREHGFAIAKSAPAREKVDLQALAPDAPKNVTKRFIGDILEARLLELFEMIGGELDTWGRAGRLAEGVVLVGGGTHLEGIADLARRELKLSTEICTDFTDSFSLETGTLEGGLRDPDFAVALGLVLWAQKDLAKDGGTRRFAGLSGGPKAWLKYFLP